MRVWQEQRRSKIREIRNEKQEKNGEKENKNACQDQEKKTWRRCVG